MKILHVWLLKINLLILSLLNIAYAGSLKVTNHTGHHGFIYYIPTHYVKASDIGDADSYRTITHRKIGEISIPTCTSSLELIKSCFSEMVSVQSKEVNKGNFKEEMYVVFFTNIEAFRKDIITHACLIKGKADISIYGEGDCLCVAGECTEHAIRLDEAFKPYDVVKNKKDSCVIQ